MEAGAGARADVANYWLALRWLGELWHREKGDPPADFRPDDGPAFPVPRIRRLLWPAQHNGHRLNRGGNRDANRALWPRTATVHWLEAIYNRWRRHSAIDMLSPVDYEERYWNRRAAA